VGIPARIIESQAGVSADVSPFNAYGITQQDDPLSQALHQLIEHAAQQERQIAQLRQALEKIAPGACADGLGGDKQLPIDQLNKMV
jgi:serine O-acetyltransferase